MSAGIGSINCGDEKSKLLSPNKFVIQTVGDSHDANYGSTTILLPNTIAGHSQTVQTYNRRWWILFIFSLCTMSQSAQWNTWNPISDAVEIAYGWNDSVVTMFSGIACASFAVCGLPAMYFIELKGLRFGTVLGASMVIATIALWNLAVALEENWLVVIGSLLNGVSGCCVASVPALLSVTWFPSSERMTATAIATSAIFLGTGMSFITGPYISGVSVTPYDVDHEANLTTEYKDDLRAGIERTLYFNAGMALLCFLCVVVYFPAKPPKPPSVSADVGRADFQTGLRDLFKNPQLYFLLSAFIITNGTFNSWLPLISVNFRDLGVSEAAAGWMGFVSIMSGCTASIFLSAFIDHFKRKMKLFLQLMSLLSIAGLVILICIQERYIRIPESALTGILFTLVAFLGICVNAAPPLYFELACEITYPVHEGLTVSVLTTGNNLFSFFYFLLFLNPALAQDTQWMTWLLLGTCILSLPILFLLRESFGRLDLETERSDSDSLSENDGSTLSS